jgi:hypothetical protein
MLGDEKLKRSSGVRPPGSNYEALEPGQAPASNKVAAEPGQAIKRGAIQ